MIRFECDGKKYGIYFVHAKGLISKPTFSGERRFTQAMILNGHTKDAEVVLSATSICNVGDNFCKGVGRLLSFETVLQDQPREFRCAAWRAYRSVCRDSKQVFDMVKKIKKNAQI